MHPLRYDVSGDKASFVLTESLTIKRVTPLDVIKENADTISNNDDDRFDSDIVLMTGELSCMLTDLVVTLGGAVADQKNTVTEVAKTST
jgi:recombination associated protein RdgC